jgi:hypothetical protein
MKTHRLLGMGDESSSAIASLAVLILSIGRSIPFWYVADISTEGGRLGNAKFAHALVLSTPVTT